MNKELLQNTASKLLASNKGLLAMDESTPTITKRFDAMGIECNEQTRREYRQLLVTAPGLEEYISGLILYDETIHQSLYDNTPLTEYLYNKKIVPGIKVDTGAKPLALHEKEKITEGLDGLRERLKKYWEIGARFAKWRAVITIGNNIPSQSCISANAHALARYAALAQEANIVPVVEPEILLDGDHSIDKCYEITSKTLTEMFKELEKQQVFLEGTILKASMVLSGNKAHNRASAEEVADMTIKCLKESVPNNLAGIVFLSGGQTEEEAALHLSLMNKTNERLPWLLSFSYSRAIQKPVLKIWALDKEKNTEKAQEALLFRARMCSLATQGKYDTDLEKEKPYSL